MLEDLIALVACGCESTVLLQSCHGNGLSVILVGNAGVVAVVEEMRTDNAESICISFVMVVIISERYCYVKGRHRKQRHWRM